MKSFTYLLVLGSALVFSVISGASIASNLIEEATPRIASSEQLISSIVNECFEHDSSSAMNCLKGKVLVYLDGLLGLQEEQARAFEEQNVDKVIFDRVARVLATNEFRLALPSEETVVSYRADKGIKFDSIPAGLATESRGHLLKKKLLLPVLLLLKLKMKALMPIFVALIGLKAMKALILSKLAITIVLGFIIAQLVKKSGLGMPMMSMTPMMPPAPAAEYGAPVSATSEAPTSSYGAPSWESQSGGPYSRVWEPSTSGSSHSLAYSSYYPSSSSYSSTAYHSASSSGASPSSSSSSSPPSSSSSSSSSAHAY
ncbi:uncharacterized protein LOC129739024 isoform X1 [Uranotaenia lowii]|uniref:uncharacterized protein LOC129739024 isoform X1 n=1 Tax=Uranotaenia lowii TaxID=190385 RepID=UPI00247A3C22|nr:uncharacterized protein LOC129739024 isoform X1 [Uranotaenia lowii]